MAEHHDRAKYYRQWVLSSLARLPYIYLSGHGLEVVGIVNLWLDPCRSLRLPNKPYLPYHA